MVGYTYEEVTSDFSPLSEIRNLKIRMLTEDIKFEVKDNLCTLYSNYLNFIDKQYPDSIISGSLALNLYSLINRDIRDIDLIVDQRPTGVFHKDTYGDENIMTTSDRLGYQYITEDFSWRHLFKKRQIFNVDFFLNKNKVKYNTFIFNKKTYRIQDPVQIAEQKLEMVNNAENYMYASKRKHNVDLFTIFKNLNWDNEDV